MNESALILRRTARMTIICAAVSMSLGVAIAYAGDPMNDGRGGFEVAVFNGGLDGYETATHAVVMPKGYDTASFYNAAGLVQKVSLSEGDMKRGIVVEGNDQLYIGSGVIMIINNDHFVVLRSNRDSYMNKKGNPLNENAGWLSSKAIAGLFGMPSPTPSPSGTAQREGVELPPKAAVPTAPKVGN